MKKSLLITALLISVTCASAPARASDNTFWGTAIGGALGGWAGSGIGKGDGRLAATGAGVFLGGLIGNSVGQSMDRADAAYYGGGYSAAPTYYQSYQPYEPAYVAPPPAPQVVYYEQPSVVQYYVPRQSSVYVDSGYVGPRHSNHRRHGRQHCREFTQSVRIDGYARESYGTACLRPDGSWQIEQ